MTLSIALFFALVAAVVVLVLRWIGQPGSREPEPERLLAARFANGEIDADEYASRLARLRVERGGTRRPKAAAGRSQIPPD
jgi:putative membrane protein